MPERWAVGFDAAANLEKYKIPRGQAAVFAEAVSVLFEGPCPSGYRQIEGFEEVYEYTKNDYRIVYEVIPQQRRIRVLLFQPL